MQTLRFLFLSMLAFLVLAVGSVLVARLHEHQNAREQAAALDRPEARVALAKAWPTR